MSGKKSGRLPLAGRKRTQELSRQSLSGRILAYDRYDDREKAENARAEDFPILITLQRDGKVGRQVSRRLIVGLESGSGPRQPCPLAAHTPAAMSLPVRGEGFVDLM